MVSRAIEAGAPFARFTVGNYWPGLTGAGREPIGR